jgi:antitoxin component YwqK of YwqJK toxin-antitoxin module
VTLERGIYHKGQLNGIREILFPDGTVKVRERYINGQITDLYEYFFPNGQHELKGYYIGGAMYGPWKKYNDKGQLLEIVTMVNNEEMGPFEEYNPDGSLAAQGNYLHGPNEDGLLKLFDESGELYKTMLCDSGRCITSWEKE